MGARPAESMPADAAVFGMSCDSFSDGFGGYHDCGRKISER